ncbi:RagB/SusD family nutrient uptake outer membrane protein [Flavivirga abyssicola]|uniref:RagB/SusD family nutrient uptake outer membrane protein n=1 Tax=Flavivirga abyssicola TaxID=3063533 RepID=UPI0026E10473|nr:RagB/SusD family nutrient uptake outer membrane protein [Flavivirga sp. MEBiC07777]WVK11652.1 RagB/SusD family nutrient uptake outer membrane protein [Flavivirga sp. MEBiC07777]
MENIKYIILIFTLAICSVSCDEDLDEVPKDFLSPSNSFVSKENFLAALGDIYRANRLEIYTPNDSRENHLMMGFDVDLAWVENKAPNVYLEVFNWNTFTPDSKFASRWWKTCYGQIFRANTIIDRAESSSIKWESDEEKNAIVGEAKFLRAYYYRLLANMYGGVPLVLEETQGAKFDYTRETREAIYLQCKEDLTFAIQWMPTVGPDHPSGRAPRAAAYHILSEVNIQLKDYTGAIAAASSVINDPNYKLMTERFGPYKDFQWNGYDGIGPFEPWGDVYFDLFRDGSMNREEGNMEMIWNIQLEYGVEAGTAGSNDSQGRFGLERWWGGAAYINVRDINGDKTRLKDTLGGRPTGNGGATDYMNNQVWNFKGDFDRDIRNSKYNVQRTYYWNNPAQEFFGQPLSAATVEDPAILLSGNRTTPSYKKAVTTVHKGVGNVGGQNTDWGRIFKDWYLIRLAETYLLRAEAYHLNGDNTSAANDINEVRSRANATPVTGGEVDLDLILDERARELYMEEYRVSTLTRMGKLAEYLRKYNSAVLANGYVLDDKLNLMPIPNSEIEANSDAVLEQNPGYN